MGVVVDVVHALGFVRLELEIWRRRAQAPDLDCLGLAMPHPQQQPGILPVLSRHAEAKVLVSLGLIASDMT